MGRGLWRKGVSERREGWLSQEQNRLITLNSTNGGLQWTVYSAAFPAVANPWGCDGGEGNGLNFDE